jgi:hypothetical protein
VKPTRIKKAKRKGHIALEDGREVRVADLRRERDELVAVREASGPPPPTNEEIELDMLLHEAEMLGVT